MTYELWQHGPPGSGGQQLGSELWGQEHLSSVCLMPGWTLSWFRHDFWRTMKEPWRIYEGMRLQLPINLFLENHSMGSDQAWSAWVYMNSSQWNFNWAGVKTFNSVLWSFVLLTFWRVCILYASLFQRARGICLMKKLSIPNWGGHWSYVCAWMCVCVSECMRVCKWQRFLLYPLVLLMPHSEEYKCSHVNTFCHSPADNWVCCLSG